MEYGVSCLAKVMPCDLQIPLQGLNSPPPSGIRLVTRQIAVSNFRCFPIPPWTPPPPPAPPSHVNRQIRSVWSMRW